MSSPTTKRIERPKATLYCFPTTHSRNPLTRKAAAEEFFKFAFSNFERGKISVAEEWYKRVLQENPCHSAARLNLGIIAVGREQWQKAEQQFREAIRIEPTYALAHFNLAYVLGELEQWDEEIEHYRRAISYSPEFPDAHFNLALAYEKEEDDGKAIQHYRLYVKYASPGESRRSHAQKTIVSLSRNRLAIVRKLPPNVTFNGKNYAILAEA